MVFSMRTRADTRETKEMEGEKRKEKESESEKDEEGEEKSEDEGKEKEESSPRNHSFSTFPARPPLQLNHSIRATLGMFRASDNHAVIRVNRGELHFRRRHFTT